MNIETISDIVEMQSCDGGIESLIEKQFIEKLIGFANLNDREILAISSCVMDNLPKSHLAKEIGVSPSRVAQIIEHSIRKLQYAYVKHRHYLAGQNSDVYINPKTNIDKGFGGKETTSIDQHGAKHWYKDGLHHRCDGPAVEQLNGGKAWFWYGKRHRANGPAIEYADGSKEWWLYGKRHKEFGYAVDYKNGKQEKWFYGKKID